MTALQPSMSRFDSPLNTVPFAHEVAVDPGRFDEFQHRLLEEFVESIHDGLKAAGITDDQVLYEAAGDIAFSVATTIVGSRIMDLGRGTSCSLVSRAEWPRLDGCGGRRMDA